MSQPPEDIANIPAFQSAFAALGALSKYADTVAGAVLSGTLSPAETNGFTAEIARRYDTLLASLLDAVTPDVKDRVAEKCLPLPAGRDPLAVAVCLDQTFVAFQSVLNTESFASQLRLTALRIGIEEAATREEAIKHGSNKDVHGKTGLYV